MENRLKDLEVRVSKLEDNKQDVNTMVAVITEKLDNIVKSIDKLSLQLEKNVIELNAKYDKLEDKYDMLEKELNNKTTGKDADKWNKVVAAIITGIVGIMIGLLFK